MKDKIGNEALESLRLHSGIEGSIVFGKEFGNDGVVSFEFNRGKEDFVALIKKEVRQYQIPDIKLLSEKNNNFILISETLFPKIKEELRRLRIAYLDVAGNFFYHSNQYFFFIDGQKSNKKQSETTKKTFKMVGIKQIFLFLTNPEIINQSQRVVSEEAGVALGSINNVMKSLKEQQFLIGKNKSDFQLMNKKELLNKWMIAYGDALKPTLHIGNFKFLNKDNSLNWKELKLKRNHTYWGGESAAAIITNYLNPEIFTLYTDESRNELIRNYQLVPDPNGNIKVYQKFWNRQKEIQESVVHPILIYADLMNSGNERCFETAKIIYESYIQQNV